MAATADFDALNIPPGIGTKTPHILKVRRIAFGDGLSQRAVDGLNAQRDNWQVKFDKLTNAQATIVLDFLDARKGTEAFLWTPPGEASQKQFTSGLGSITTVPLIGGQNKTITVTFVQEFDL